MAKIGTAHVEIKPVLDEDALTAITDKIAEAVQAGVRRGMRDARYDATNCPDCHGRGYIDVHTIGLEGGSLQGRPCPAGCKPPILRNLDPDGL